MTNPTPASYMRLDLIMPWLIESLKRQGLIFVVLCGIIVYFHGQSEQTQAKVDLCNSKIINMYEANAIAQHEANISLIEAVNNNTVVIKELANRK